MGIGDYVMFLYKGHKVWEGSNETIMDSDVKELQDFVFANKIMKTIKR
jgi:phospholipid/cholesterol/gamma-HCH transport system ATP-binding protein